MSSAAENLRDELLEPVRRDPVVGFRGVVALAVEDHEVEVLLHGFLVLVARFRVQLFEVLSDLAEI